MTGAAETGPGSPADGRAEALCLAAQLADAPVTAALEAGLALWSAELDGAVNADLAAAAAPR